MRDLGADAVDDFDLREVGIDHQLVDIEHHSLSALSHHLYGCAKVIVPLHPPDDQHVSVEEFANPLRQLVPTHPDDAAVVGLGGRDVSDNPILMSGRIRLS